MDFLRETAEIPTTDGGKEFSVKQESLTLFQTSVVKLENPGWSLKTIEYVDTMEEYNVYKEADLEQQAVGEKVALVRDDIDFEQKDEFGRTNTERIRSHLSPLNRQGEVVELHHIGQEPDSPFAELTRTEHRGAGNDTVLHDKSIESRIDREEYNKEKMQYWKTRLEMEGVN